MLVRKAMTSDASAIADIYNHGILDRIATFETRLRSADDILSWFDGAHPIVVVEDQGKVVGFAASSSYGPRECYRGVAEVSVYVARESRRRGVGRLVLSALIDECRSASYWKLVSRVFTDNVASRRLIAECGFREVGIHEKHAQLDGVWRDVVIVERWIG